MRILKVLVWNFFLVFPKQFVTYFMDVAQKVNSKPLPMKIIM